MLKEQIVALGQAQVGFFILS